MPTSTPAQIAAKIQNSYDSLIQDSGNHFWLPALTDVHKLESLTTQYVNAGGSTFGPAQSDINTVQNDVQHQDFAQVIGVSAPQYHYDIFGV